MIAVGATVLLAACQGSIGASSSPRGGTPATSANTFASGSTPSRNARIGVDLPLHGDAGAGRSVLNAVRMAIDDANAADGSGGWTLLVSVTDDADPNTRFADPQIGAANVRSLAADPEVIGIVGPYNSTVARAEIPITNQAGLLQCGPSTTNPALTEPPAALQYRPVFPDRISFVRVAAPDDLQGPAAARYAITILHKMRAFVLDDAAAFGQGVAGAFEAEFTAEGGTVVGRASAPGTTSDYAPILAAAKAKNSDVFYFGGAVVTGAGLVRKQMAEVGLGDLPFLGPDGVADPSFISLAGSAAANSYATIDAIGDYPDKADFTARYRARFDSDLGPYTAAGYACAQLILDALRRATGTDPRTVREEVRAYAVDRSHALGTILGDVSFDANGDTTRPVISVYKVDLTAAGGKGDWVFEDQVTFAKP